MTRRTTLSLPLPLLPFVLALAGCAGAASGASAQEAARCGPAERLLVRLGLVAVAEADTIDDWRSGKVVAGCRVTAAGVTTRSLRAEAEAFYQRVRDAGWTRTPDPRDAPNESSLRFRLDDTDCLFNLYEGILLGTAAEVEVSTRAAARAGEERYNLLVQCIPAMDARPR